MDFEDKVILITGAAGGIGKETARAFQNEGASLVLVDINKNALEDMVDELGLKDYLLIPADVTDENEVKNYINLIIDKYRKIDVFFNNAGITGKFAEITEVTSQDFNKVIDINLKGAFYGLKYVLQVMNKQNFGCIINTASTAGVNGSPSLGPYAATKHAIVGLTKTAAIEGAKRGIRVNAICPAPVDTELMNKLDKDKDTKNPEKARKSYEQKIPLGRYASPEEIAELVLFLSSSKSSYITGGVYNIDGGLLAN